MTRVEVAQGAGVLSRAFEDNPLFQGVLGFMSAPARHAAVRRVKKGFIEGAVRAQHAEALHVDGTMVAASLYCTPAEYPLSLRAKFWLGTGCVTTGVRGLRNFLRLDSYL